MAALPPDLAERLLAGSPDAILICDPAGIGALLERRGGADVRLPCQLRRSACQ